MKLSIIVAVAENGVIGRGGDLPWQLSSDLRRFKALTLGHHLLVGRRTWESIGRPLPGRAMVVVSRQPGYRPPGVQVVASPEEAVELARRAGEEEAVVAGGGELYRALLPRADALYLTRVHAEVEGDTFFPPVDLEAWELLREEEHPAGEKDSHPTTFQVYARRRPR